jgi:hypothetical protein
MQGAPTKVYSAYSEEAQRRRRIPRRRNPKGDKELHDSSRDELLSGISRDNT